MNSNSFGGNLSVYKKAEVVYTQPDLPKNVYEDEVIHNTHQYNDSSHNFYRDSPFMSSNNNHGRRSSKSK